MTALMYAARQGNEPIVRHLLQGKASPAIISRAGMTALLYAVERDHEQIVR